MASDIAIECPSCGASFRIPGEYAGRDARCKKCDSKIRVPISKSPNGEDAEERSAVADSTAQPMHGSEQTVNSIHAHTETSHSKHQPASNSGPLGPPPPSLRSAPQPPRPSLVPRVPSVGSDSGCVAQGADERWWMSRKTEVIGLSLICSSILVAGVVVLIAEERGWFRAHGSLKSGLFIASLASIRWGIASVRDKRFNSLPNPCRMIPVVTLSVWGVGAAILLVLLFRWISS